jgi:hypothetical protein
MTNVLRWVVVAALVGHGLIHLLGAAKGLGWSEVAQLKEPIGPGLGAVWLLGAVLVLVSAGLLAAGAPTWWWAVALGSAAVSQVATSASWNDARAGTAINLVLVLAAAYSFASVGPASFHAQWRAQASQALSAADRQTDIVTETDLADLPGPVAAYVRRSGAVGQPRVTSFAASFHGRIRSGPSEPWMPFTGRQVNTYGPRPQRAFIMDATRSGLPVTVLHQFSGASATMRAKVLSLVPVVDAAGPEMDQGETVTVFNDLVVFAPGAIVDAPIRWTAMDATQVRGVFTNEGLSVTAVLTFDSDHRLVDFSSLDRLRASADGTSFTALPWSTPLSGHRDFGGHLLPQLGAARWDAPPPEGSFTYVELDLDDIAFNVRDLGCFAAGGMTAAHGRQHQLPSPVVP